jgi:hypothetical protein
MKFWIIRSADDEMTLGCELTKKQALLTASEMGYERQHVTVEAVDVDVTAESIRRLLGDLGGYAN